MTTDGKQTPHHEVAADVDKHEHAGQLAQPQALPAVAQGCLYGSVPRLCIRVALLLRGTGMQ